MSDRTVQDGRPMIEKKRNVALESLSILRRVDALVEDLGVCALQPLADVLPCATRPVADRAEAPKPDGATPQAPASY